ncbi:energy transducer TonB [Aureivirga sp. CE67]|uniref:energy transducer TonB n=1 Tax=Aureivirga sp. CE67 TaxID=1788983 RepID=UPI0018CA27B0|nr:energy transducer TonB [Aureivirga sp. CE67]
MKKEKITKLLFFVLILLSIKSFSQDTLYLDKDREPTKLPENISYYLIEKKEKKVISKQLYDLNWNIIFEKNFIKKGKKTLSDGRSTFWNEETGKKEVIYTYKKGKYHGEMISFWEDESIKRKDIYKNGKFIEGKCFDINGNVVPYYPHTVNPEYFGGRQKLFEYISNNIDPKKLPNKNLRVVVEFFIDKDGKVIEPKINENINEPLKKHILQLFHNMPDWIPGKRDNIPVKVKYHLPLSL